MPGTQPSIMSGEKLASRERPFSVINCESQLRKFSAGVELLSLSSQV